MEACPLAFWGRIPGMSSAVWIRPVLFLGLLVAVVLTVASLAQSPSPRRPNVMLIIADDMGYGDIGAYGATDTRTPHLDRLAGEGVRLTDFYANAPVCTPTRAALMTGRYQQRLMLERPLASVGPDLEAVLPVTGRSLPQLLKDAGYRTALVGKWHLGYRPDAGPRAHGFDYFWGFLSGYLDWYTHVRGDGQHDVWENETPVQAEGYFHHETTRRAQAEIDRSVAEGRPFFLEVAYGAPHWPFQSPSVPSVAERRNNSMTPDPSDANAATRADYVAIMEDFDSEIGKLLERVRHHDIERDTLVIFMSDNGGEWLSRNSPLFHRKDTVWEGGVRVPAILRWPARLPRGMVSGQVGITMDISASVVAAAGVNRPDLAFEGQNLVDLLDTGRVVERELMWRVTRPNVQQRAVRAGDFKYVEDGGLRFLFNVRTDPGEREDLTGRYPERVRALRERVEAWEADVNGEAARLPARRP
jgi:arylsulfatase A-like enzyme